MHSICSFRNLLTSIQPQQYPNRLPIRTVPFLCLLKDRELLKSSCGLSPDLFCHLLNSQAMHDTIIGYATGTTINMLPVDALTAELKWAAWAEDC